MANIIDIYTDGHVHTSLCHHATGTMEDYVAAAIQKGLKHIVFLEHLEIGIQYFESTWLSEEDFSQYCQEGIRLKEKSSAATIVCGMRGQQAAIERLVHQAAQAAAAIPHSRIPKPLDAGNATTFSSAAAVSSSASSSPAWPRSWTRSPKAMALCSTTPSSST